MRTTLIIKYVFAALGLAMLLGTLFFYTKIQDSLKNSKTTTGTVTEFVLSGSTSDSTTYRPVVEFKTQDGTLIEFTSSFERSHPSYSKGEVVEVLYQESFPEQAEINSFMTLWLGPIVLGTLGVMFFLVGFIMILFGIRRSKKIKYLKKNGTPVRAKFQSVVFNNSVIINGRSPYQIYVQWINPTTSELHIFHSENIWFDPTDHINSEVITVLIEKDNPKEYYVDTSFLPRLAG